MHTCSRAPMIGRRMGWGDHDRSDHRATKLTERAQLAADLIAEFAIEPETPRAIASDELEGWLYFAEPDEYDPFDDDDRPYLDLLGDIAEEGDLVDISTIDDETLPGWGTHLAWEDIATGFTITRRPYGYTRGDS